jgi:hypothetical protein
MKESSFTAICMTVKAPYKKCLVRGFQSKNVHNGWKQTVNLQVISHLQVLNRNEASLYLLDEY